jgi:tetratricopeptide (TPR) repeat protein
MGRLGEKWLSQTLLILLAVALFAGGICVRKEALGDVPRQSGQELMYFPSGKFLKQSALGHTSTLADIAWLRAIQYYGHHRLTDKKYDMVGHIFDIVTTLDPNFVHAYVFGAIVLAQDAGRPEEGLALLKKGMRHNPENWLLAFETGFIYHIMLKDYENAGRYFRLASVLPNAPSFPARFAAFANERAGRTETAIQLWSEIAKATPNTQLKEIAEEHIEKLKVELKSEKECAL